MVKRLSKRSCFRLLMSTALVACFAAGGVRGEDTAPVDGFAEVRIEPPAPVIVPMAEAPAAAADMAGPVALDLPDLPAVTVTVAPATEQPVAAAVLAPEQRPADTLPAAIQSRLASKALELPPRFPVRERDALAAAYAANDGKPFWLAGHDLNPAGKALADRLSRAAEDGLDPADYPLARLAPGASDEERADAELKLSASVVLYARDARGGRLDPRKIGGLVTPTLELPGAERVLLALAGSEDAGAALEGFNPAYPGYRALRARLAELRAHHPAVASRRSSVGTRVASIGGAGSLSDRSPRLEGDLIANMERWRWLPSRVSDRYILVNVPEFRLRVVEDGHNIHQTRVITGAPSTPTPIFSDVMDHAIVNPSWFIPPSIMKKDVLPGLARDPGYASRRGYEVRQSRGVTSVRMPPGPRNALGYIKFMFPNDHAVYLHDTPNRGLFGNASRALSHGCVRVENPFALGGAIVGSKWSEGRLRGLIGRGEATIRLEERLPIHLAYFTLFVGEDGEMKSFGDVYGYHRRVRAALGFGA